MQGSIILLKYRFYFVFEEMYKSVDMVTKYLCDFLMMLILNVVSMRVNILVRVVLLFSIEDEEKYSV